MRPSSRPLVYVSGAYTGATVADIKSNVDEAVRMAKLLIKSGYDVICPHLSFYLDENFGYDYWMKFDLHIMQFADAVLMLNNWEKSKGCLIEHNEALRHHIPVVYSLMELTQKVKI